jgi:hypothetical protein
MSKPNWSQVKRCYNCQDPSHLIRQCSKPRAAQANRRLCFKCDGTGHFAFACKRQQEEKAPHVRKEGHPKQELLDQRYLLPWTTVCEKCGQEDHQQENCHRANTQCVRCEQYGHYVSECPTKRWSPAELQCYIFDKRHEDEALSKWKSRWTLS